MRHAFDRQIPIQDHRPARVQFSDGHGLRRACGRTLTVIAAIAWMTHGAASTSAADTPAPIDSTANGAATESQKLLEGDDIRISFPGAPNLDTTQKIRADGKISMPLVGEVQAAGLTPPELQKALAGLYATQLVSNEVNVAVVASTYPVYINGAVLKPGEVRCDRPTTVLEAIAKAGGFDFQRAKLENVTIIRRGENNIEINMKAVLMGKDKNLYFVKPSDVIMVQEKAFWF